jgi:hypothetical protein
MVEELPFATALRSKSSPMNGCPQTPGISLSRNAQSRVTNAQCKGERL